MNKFGLAIFGIVCFGAGAAAGYIYGEQKWKKYAEEDIADVKAFYEERLNELTIPPDGTEYVTIDDERFGKPRPNIGVNDIDDIAKQFEDDDLMGFNGMIKNAPSSGFGRSTLQSNLRSIQSGRRIVNYNNPSIEEVVRKAQNHEEMSEDEIEILFDDLDPGVQQAFIDAGMTPEEAEGIIAAGVIDLEFVKANQAAIDEIWSRVDEEKEKGNPYLIPAAEFNSGLPEDYDKVDLFYYRKDRTLCEDNDLEVETDMMEEIIGFDFEEMIDYFPVVYVRNDALGIAYAIHRLDESYATSVKGVVETPQERSRRLQNRRIEAGLEG